MLPIDYGRSFLIGLAPKNEVRFWVESRTRIINHADRTEEDYVQAASCKSERTFAETDLFQDDNYDFLPIFGPEYGVVFRRKAYLYSDYKQCLPVTDLWDGQRYHLVEPKNAVELKNNEEIREATYAMHPIVSQTEISNEDESLSAIIECPVKTLNTHRENNMHQVDTGPIVFPDLSKDYDRSVDRLSLAFVAFNVSHFADFVIEAPTSLGDGQPQVHHYSELLSLPAKNRMYALTD